MLSLRQRSEAIPHFFHRRRPIIYVLLIGIDRHTEGGLSNLTGAGNDVNKLQGLFDELGADHKAVILLNEAATRDGVLAELDNLAHDVRSGDHLLFYFAGHGLSVSVSEEVNDGSALPEQILCTYDYVLGRDGAGIPHSTLVERLDVIRERHVEIASSSLTNYSMTRHILTTESFPYLLRPSFSTVATGRFPRFGLNVRM